MSKVQSTRAGCDPCCLMSMTRVFFSTFSRYSFFFVDLFVSLIGQELLHCLRHPLALSVSIPSSITHLSPLSAYSFSSIQLYFFLSDTAPLFMCFIHRLLYFILRLLYFIRRLLCFILRLQFFISRPLIFLSSLAPLLCDHQSSFILT